jgi:nitrogen fixation NifU-like protein
MNDKLSELYQDTIIKHDREPQHYEKRPTAQYKIFLDIDNQRVTNISFHGYGCAISKAATSVLMEKAMNQPLDEVLKLIDIYLNIIKTGEAFPPSGGVRGGLETFAVAKKFPGRDKCATLSWSALKEFLEES